MESLEDWATAYLHSVDNSRTQFAKMVQLGKLENGPHHIEPGNIQAWLEELAKLILKDKET